MKRTILAVLALLVLIGTMPLALAEQTKGPKIFSVSKQAEKIAEVKETIVEKTTASCIKRVMAEDSNISEEQAEEACKVKIMPVANQIHAKIQTPAFEQYKKELQFKAREIQVTRLQQARQNFHLAKANMEQATTKLKLASANFLIAKKNLDCTDPESKKCTDTGAYMLDKAKEFFEHKADLYVNYLTKVKSRIDSNEYMNETRAEEMSNWIDEKISLIEGIKSDIQAATTKEELLNAVKELEQERNRFRYRVEAFAGTHINSRIGGIIVKSAQLETRLDKILSKAEELGVNTSSLDLLIGEFKTHIAKASDSFDEAQSLFDEARLAKSDATDSELKSKVQDAQKKMSEAKKSLQDAQKSLQAIVAKLRELNLESLIIDSDESDQPEDEDDSDDDDTDTN